MLPLQIVHADHNALAVRCAAGDHLTVFPAFIATGDFQVKPVASRDLPVSRLLAGRLMECRFDAPTDERTVQLHGPDPHGRFLVVHVAEGQAMFVRLDALAAYRLGPGARFFSSPRPLSPVRWFSGTAFAVIARGPADLVFYGPDLVLNESADPQQCFAHRLVAFDARTPFRIQGLRPRGQAGTLFDALSSVVDVSFLGGTPVVRRTAVEGTDPGARLRQAARLILGGLICGSLVEHLLFSRWLWSLIS